MYCILCTESYDTTIRVGDERRRIPLKWEDTWAHSQPWSHLTLCSCEFLSLNIWKGKNQMEAASCNSLLCLIHEKERNVSSHQTIEPARPLLLTNWAFSRMESTSSNPTHLQGSSLSFVRISLCLSFFGPTHWPGSIGDVGSKVASIHNCLPGLRSGTWKPVQPEKPLISLNCDFMLTCRC